MLASKAKWDFINNKNELAESVDRFKGMSTTTSTLLVQRGIVTEEAAVKFVSPDLSELHNPGKLSDIDKATDRVHKAIEANEKILVYGDYDADGVSSTTLLLKVLLELGADCDFYIPNRFTEGYGPNEVAFQAAHEKGFRVIITVDTGIASVHEATVANELGIDLIITDHHELQEQLPDAYAIINPKCSSEYLFPDLAGVGVAFKFSERLLGYFPEHLLDLVAVGTIADLVPLINENRILAYYGLRTLSNTKNLGLRALKRICNIEGNVTEEDVGFQIGPRINAVGRIRDARLAVQLLMTEDEEEALEIADTIELINQERQQIVSMIVDEAEKMVDLTDAHSVIIVAKEGWNEGVLGIVASQLVRKYDRPAFVLAIKPDTSEVKGSARSIPAFNLFNNCMEFRDLFSQFGGHSQAAGMTLPLENLEVIQTKLNDRIKQQLTEDDFKQVIEVSQTLSVADVDEKLIEEINKLSPFGMANPKPQFHIESAPTEIRQIGNMKKHLKFQFKDGNKLLDGIGFGMGNMYLDISSKATVSIVGELGINEWNGIRKPQIIMRDMAINEWQLFDHRGKKDFNILPYIKDSENSLIIRNDTSRNPEINFENVNQITYDTEISKVSEADTLYILDLPADLLKLKEIIKASKPKNIHTCYYVEDSVYLKRFPSRDAFKKYYGLVLKRKKLDLKIELKNIMNRSGWTKDKVIFMSKVFSELEFIKIDNGVIEVNSAAPKRNLEESKLYQERLVDAEIEKTLYYSNYDELKKWFAKSMESIDVAEEEVVHGL